VTGALAGVCAHPLVWGLLDAELARGALEAAGIEAFLFDDNMVRMDWFNANALGGVKLCVDAHNVEAANRVLQEADQHVSAVDPDEPGIIDLAFRSLCESHPACRRPASVPAIRPV